jgi:hypothetical protein
MLLCFLSFAKKRKNPLEYCEYRTEQLEPVEPIAMFGEVRGCTGSTVLCSRPRRFFHPGKRRTGDAQISAQPLGSRRFFVADDSDYEWRLTTVEDKLQRRLGGKQRVMTLFDLCAFSS